MENRFGFKDLVMLVLLAVLIVSIWLSMKQEDRTWEALQSVRGALTEQTRDLADIRRQLSQGVAVTTRPQDATHGAITGSDPFARLKKAKQNPDFAYGDWVVDAFSTNLDKITPLISTTYYNAILEAYVLESLMTYNPDTLQIEPVLAESWTISEDGLTVTFNLRRNVTFSDGEPMTADDVVFTYDFTMNPEIDAPRSRAYYSRLESVTKTGPYQVVFKFKEPYFKSFEIAGLLQVLPKHFYSRFTPAEINSATGLLMGTGPYRLEDPVNGWKPGVLLKLVRNNRYWGEQAGPDGLVFREVQNDVARTTMFRNGEIDYMLAMPDQYLELLKDPELVARSQPYAYFKPTSGYCYVAWNQRRKDQPTVFADQRVRQAMTMLIQRWRVCEQVLGGLAEVPTGPFNPMSWQSNPDVEPWPYDPARAKALLKEAGFEDRDGDGVVEGPDGKPLRFKLVYPAGTKIWEDAVLLMKDGLAQAGVVLEPDPLQFSVFTDRIRSRDFDAISLCWGGVILADPYQIFHSDQIADDGDNFISYSNPELDKLIEEGRRTVDQEKSQPIWHQVHRILHEDQPYTFLYMRKECVFMSNRYKNVGLTKIGVNDRTEWYVPTGVQRWTSQW